MSAEHKLRSARINEVFEHYGRKPTTNELRAINNLPLGGKADLRDISANGRKIWDLLEKSERLHDVSLLEEAGRLLWMQVTDHDPRAEVDRSAYDKWLATPPKPQPGYKYTPMSNFVGESKPSGNLRRDGIRVEINPAAPVSASASASASASSFNASQDRFIPTWGIYHQHPSSTNPSVLPIPYLPSNTPQFSQPDISRPTNHTLQTVYSGNFTGSHQHSNMIGVEDSFLPHKVPATPAPMMPEFLDNMDSLPPILDTDHTMASSTTKTNEQRSPSRGFDVFDEHGLPR